MINNDKLDFNKNGSRYVQDIANIINLPNEKLLDFFYVKGWLVGVKNLPFGII